MRKLLVLIVGLLLVSPAWAQSGSGKGMVDHVTTAELTAAPYVCDATTAGLHGLRVYDITANVEMTCSETTAAWVVSGGTGVVGDITILSNDPTLTFDDSSDAGDTNAAITVDCDTGANECDMVFGVNSGTATADGILSIETPVTNISYVEISETAPILQFEDINENLGADAAAEGSITVNTDGDGDASMSFAVEAGEVLEAAIEIDGVAADDYDVYIGRGTTTAADFVRFTEGGLIYQHSSNPFVYIHDLGETNNDATYEGGFLVNCPTEDNCDMKLIVESGADNWIAPMHINTAGGATSIQFGDATATVADEGTNYIGISEAGRMDTVGTALIMAPTDFFQICGDNDTINSDTVYYGPDLTLTSNTTGLACDITAAGGAEGAVDEPVFTNQAFQVVGMTCRSEKDTGSAISYTLRTAAGATVPSVTCTIDGTGAAVDRDCVADIQTTTGIAAGATVAIAATSADAIGAVEGFICNVFITY